MPDGDAAAAADPDARPPRTPLSAAPSVWRRAAAAAISLAVVFALAFCLRLALLALGDAIYVIGRQRGLAELLVPVAELLLFAFAALLGAFVLHRRRAARLTVVAGALVALAWAARASLDVVHESRHVDFHGVRTVPANQRWTDDHPGRPRVAYRSNRFGFRGDDFEAQKTPGTVRVALVGDSFVFGQGVEEPDTLKARLDELLAARGLAGRIEVLNLGLCGNNLATHIRMYEIAHRELAADVVVMGLFVHNDLAEWDYQDEIRGMARPGAFSTVAWLLGEEPAVALATMLFVQHGSEARAHAALDRLLPRLDAARARPGAPHLLVLPYHCHDDAVAARFRARRGLTWLTPPEAPENYLAGDGHPSPLGNRRYAAVVFGGLLDLPPVRAVAGAPP